jgi:hypothetical protein
MVTMHNYFFNALLQRSFRWNQPFMANSERIWQFVHPPDLFPPAKTIGDDCSPLDLGSQT